MINGRIVGKRNNGDVIIRPDKESREDLETIIQRRKMLVTLQPFDADKATRLQQKKAHALIHDINNFSNNDPMFLAENDLKFKFCDAIGWPTTPMFSLANCSKELASQFINFLVEYCFKHEIPFDRRELHLSMNVHRMMFLSAVHNRCFATQARRQDAVLHIHHVNAVGRGKRYVVDHRNRYYMILTAEMHNEIHAMGYWRFCEKWHCGAIKLTDQQIIDFKLMSKAQMKERDADPDYEIKDWQLPTIDEIRSWRENNE
ncbi:putative HNHc nuclease [Enterococcus sp.]|uniref:putative HNHc nuclease n=1 Tax=Enterococcus sp. TaxID=35783 RepID=UPI0028966999|nr:putative HNHc nuclease [Enterococcus sp.]